MSHGKTLAAVAACVFALIGGVFMLGQGAPEAPSMLANGGAPQKSPQGDPQPGEGSPSLLQSSPSKVPSAPSAVSSPPTRAAEAPGVLSARDRVHDHRGSVFGVGATGADPGGSKRIVYVLDNSSSMRPKIERAKGELARALMELQPGDTFNIIVFNDEVEAYASSMIAVNSQTVQYALAYVASIRVTGGTNISAALDRALGLRPITHIFLLSDGQPTSGITHAEMLRSTVRGWNTQHARILTLALGESDYGGGWFGDSDNIPLLSALAHDSGGVFKQVTVSR